jgi:hypothetical protein
MERARREGCKKQPHLQRVNSHPGNPSMDLIRILIAILIPPLEVLIAWNGRCAETDRLPKGVPRRIEGMFLPYLL